jgi:hypothetical protein
MSQNSQNMDTRGATFSYIGRDQVNIVNTGAMQHIVSDIATFKRPWPIVLYFLRSVFYVLY